MAAGRVLGERFGLEWFLSSATSALGILAIEPSGQKHGEVLLGLLQGLDLHDALQ